MLDHEIRRHDAPGIAADRADIGDGATGLHAAIEHDDGELLARLLHRWRQRRRCIGRYDQNVAFTAADKGGDVGNLLVVTVLAVSDREALDVRLVQGDFRLHVGEADDPPRVEGSGVQTHKLYGPGLRHLVVSTMPVPTD